MLGINSLRELYHETIPFPTPPAAAPALAVGNVILVDTGARGLDAGLVTAYIPNGTITGDLVEIEQAYTRRVMTFPVDALLPHIVEVF